MKKLLRHRPADPRQLGLLLDHFSAEPEIPPVRTLAGNDDALFRTPQPPAPSIDAVPSTRLPPAPQAPQESPPQPPVRGRRRIQLQARVLEYTLLRSKRRSIGLVIDDEGLRVTAPRWVTLAQIEEAILEKQRWILTKLHERRERSARRLQPQLQWCDGASLPYLGQDIVLRIVGAQKAGVLYDETARVLTVSLPAGHTEQQLKDRVLSWLQSEARILFARRLPIYAEKLGVSYKSFRLSSAMTQWGSCTADGRIRLNWRLMFFALEQIDYVIAHELSHLREMNHSPAFWATVQSVFPEFAAAKKVLRERGPDTLPSF